MLSYHNDENLKNLVVSEMKNHQEKDQFIKGSYNKIKDSKFNGCAVGCTIDSLNLVCNKSYDTDEHSVFEEALGIPKWLARLQDLFFENLPENENSQFAVDFLDSIPVGVNLEPVKWKLCSFILKEGIERILNQKNIPEEISGKVIKSMQGVLSVHQSAINTGKWNSDEAWSAWSASWSASWSAEWSSAWSSAESAARSAEWSSAESSSRSVAESAAWSARSAADSARSVAESARSAARSARSVAWSAWSAARSARSAAWSAARSARSEERSAWSAARSARSAAFKRYSEELIRLLKEIG